MSERRCADCGCVLPYQGRGRPRERCKHCADRQIAAKARAYYERNRDEIAAKNRAYRERNHTCSGCGERLRRPSPSGLCGVCEEEAA